MPIEDIIKQLEQPLPTEDRKKSDETVMLLDMLGSGLAPENPFAGIGTALVGMEQEAEKAKGAETAKRASDLMSAYKAQATIRASTAASALSKHKLGELKKPAEMTTLKDAEGKEYEIPKEDMLEGAKIMNQINRNMNLNLLTSEQVKGLKEKMPITVDEKEFMVPIAQYQAISEATRKKAEAGRKRTASEALAGIAPADMLKPENFSNLLIANPNSAAALMNKLVPEDATGLSDTQYRYYADTNSKIIHQVLRMDDPDDALINTVNNLSMKLKDPHMLLKVPGKGIKGMLRYTRAITVPLPPNVTADMVQDEAAARGMTVSDILQTIYDKSQESK